MDTEEMSQRGVEDAEHGELNPFYYQHYYHYRRSFDKARRQQRTRALRARASLIAFVAVLVVGVGSFLAFRMPSAPQTPSASAAIATVIVTATPRPIFPTPTFVPTPEPVAEAVNQLQIDGFAVVSNTAGRALRARSEPTLGAQVQTTFREGERVRVLEGPIEADGLRWWRVEGENGSGWSAELSPNGETLLVPATQ